MKEDILARCRAALAGRETYDRPDLSDINPQTWPDTAAQFRKMAEAMNAQVADAADASEIPAIIRKAYPDAQTFCSNLPEVASIITSDPDNVNDAAALNGLDVGIVRGSFGVAENGSVWIEQTMRQRAVCFICENLVILLRRGEVVNNMHEAYRHVSFNDNGYGVFIAGPSKTADIAQVLVTGAQAARTVTIILTD